MHLDSFDDRRFENALARARKQARRPYAEGLAQAKALAEAKANEYRDIAQYVASLTLKGEPIPTIANERLSGALEAMEEANDRVKQAHHALRLA